MLKNIPDKQEGQEEVNSFANQLGLTYTRLEKGYAQCTLEIQDKLLNSHGVLHGGALFTMADSGMAATIYTYIDKDERFSTINTNITYFKPVKSGSLTCDTRLINRSKTLAAMESEIRQGDNLIAKASATWAIYKKRE